MKRNKTVGAIVTDLSTKSQENVTIIDQQRAMQEDYMKNLTEAVDRGYKRYPKNFFIEVQTKAEKLLANTFRNYFIDRMTCPTPNYDQSVFRYNRDAGRIEYIWTIPDKFTCKYLKAHISEIVNEEKDLLEFVLKFDNGTLLKISKKYNGEKLETPELIKE